LRIAIGAEAYVGFGAVAVEETTWDGLPVAREPPYAACVVVWRDGERGREVLVVHRLAPGGPGYEGEWAWTPPSGARQPGETADEAARRELREETGLALTPVPVAGPSDEVALYVAEAPPGAEVVVDAEHDRFEWLPVAEGDREVPAVAGGSVHHER
jgi:8-oxo-dGTP pyrophosphatase MutT (NUDIX family)